MSILLRPDALARYVSDVPKPTDAPTASSVIHKHGEKVTVDLGQ